MRANAGSNAMRGSFGQAVTLPMNRGVLGAQSYRGGVQGVPKTPAPAFRGWPGYNGGTNRSFGGGGFHGSGGGGGFHGFGGGHFGGGGMGGGRR
jgi:hypothetical protein